MPIYEYRCSTCESETEVLQKFSDPPLATCPSCGADALVKKISAAGFQLKGTGWYATDFKGGGKPAPKVDGAKADSKPAASADGASESSAPAAPSCGAGACSSCS
jgi:putative FmdB family regulatory protein